MESWNSVLMASLRDAPLLVSDLPGVPVLDRALLGKPQSDYALNYNQKLGHLYEDAMQHLLEKSDLISLLSSSLQVADDSGRTLGEMDFVFRDRSEGFDCHLELAVKFYLAHRSEDCWQFPGPDPRDNWQRKLDRMRTHQLRLSEDPNAKRLLKERFGITQIAVRLLIYGRLFYPMETEEHPLPEGMSVDGLRGRWLYCSEWERWMTAQSELRVIPKPLWPVVLTAELVQTLPVIEAAGLLELGVERCTLFVADDSLEPIFLVPDTWPHAEGRSL